ncbi:MAG: ATP-binding protein [Spirochaeta sp.]|nr:ATP-binding protein [Spirochaeta sp.]
MEREIIKQYILDRQEAQSKRTFFPRELEIDLDFHRQTGKIVAILGSRRAGKSTYLLQLHKELGLEPQQGIWIDFTEYLWQDFRNSDWKALWEVSLEISGPRDPVFFLDEIQELPDFASGLRYLQNLSSLVFIIGSNSSLFGYSMAESLRGKVLSYELLPLSFGEFLLFRHWQESPPYTSRQRAEMNTLLDEYLLWGGFPEVVLAGDPELKKHLLQSYVDTMLLRDVVDRHEIKNVDLVEKLFQKALLSFTKTFSVHRWYNDFKSQGRRLSKDTLYDYLSYLEESLFLITANNWTNPSAARKIYLVDNGLYQTVRSKPDKGQLWENACFLELLRRGRRPEFWLDEKGEIDLVTETELIQACYSLHEGNKGREIHALERGVKQMPGKEPVVWTREPSGVEISETGVTRRTGFPG